MKLVKRIVPDDLLEKGKPIGLVAEDPEDMVSRISTPIIIPLPRHRIAFASPSTYLTHTPKWHAYNLVLPGDIFYGSTTRKIAVEVTPGEWRSESKRSRCELAITATKILFDPITSILRVSGVVAGINPYAPLGSGHSIDLEVHRPFSIIKPDPDGWDSVAEEALRVALSDDKNGALAAVVMQPGIANICLVTQFRTVLRTRVEHVVPKKRDTAATQDAGMHKFFDKVLGSLQRAVDFTQTRPLLLASPGFVAADFKEYITTKGRDKSDKVMMNIGKLATVVHVNSGHVHSLDEALKSPEVLSTMRDVRFAKEAQVLDRFFKILKFDDGRAWYGRSVVEKAVEEGAVGPGGGALLINNSLFRSEDLAVRKKYVALVDRVKAGGGEVSIFSSDHESGERLKLLGDVAAILNYPILDLDEEDEEEELQEGVQLDERQIEEDAGMLESVI